MKEEFVFSITVETVQEAAMGMIDRRLTDNELTSVKRGIESCLLSDIHAVFETAIVNSIKTGL